MNILLLTSHSVAEHDDLDMLTRLGYDVFSIGAYTEPAHPGDTLRPALPDVRYHPHLAAACHLQRVKHAGQPLDWAIDWAKADLHGSVIDWSDVIIVHHYPERWLLPQWDRLRDKRVIWRTCGQSDPELERLMSRYEGLQIVRYSPAEKRAFERLGVFAGEDAMIRFGKDPAEWSGWTGEDAVVGNITQDMRARGVACGLGFYLSATEGLPATPAGPGSESLPGGIGALGYDEMREYLRRCRAYIYTGTRPASYTLGLIEAMMTGVPVVSIGPEAFGIPDIFEGHELVDPEYGYANFDDPGTVKVVLEDWLDYPNQDISDAQRRDAIDLFGIETVSRQWLDFLGQPGRSEFSHERESVTA